MRQVSLGTPVNPSDDKLFRQWVMAALAEIELASYDDINVAINDFSVTNYTKLRTLDGTAGTLADVKNVLCTLIADIKARGMKRSQ